jgi:hypothetical protein
MSKAENMKRFLSKYEANSSVNISPFTECVSDFDKQSEMIILKSILGTSVL